LIENGTSGELLGIFSAVSRNDSMLQAYHQQLHITENKQYSRRLLLLPFQTNKSISCGSHNVPYKTRNMNKQHLHASMSITRESHHRAAKKCHHHSTILFSLFVYIYVPQNTLFQHAKVIGCENGCRGSKHICLPEHACIGISSFVAIFESS
jgi:hypothetical protein